MIEKLTGNELKRIFNETGFGFSKSLGQNFLCDERILNMIADDANISENQTVLEIGTGAGTLTRVLSKRAKRVVSVEVDKSLLPVHKQTLDGFDNIEVVNADFLSLDIKKFYEEKLEEDFALCANLPYYITTPIIMSILESGIKFRSLTVLVQKEVAQRMAAKENTPEYGALTCAVQFYTKTHLCSKIPASCFYPAPKVASQVIRLERLEEPLVNVQSEEMFFKLVKSAFAMRRKTLANNLIASFNIDRPTAENIITESGFSSTIRGEALSIKNLAIIADKLYNILQ